MTEYRCAANDCPMVGAISMSGSNDWFCCYHHGAESRQWPRITRVLADWHCVATEANRARCAMLRVSIPVKALTEAWRRLEPQVRGAWAEELAPEPGESYRDWGRRLEWFLVARVTGAQKDLEPVPEAAEEHAPW